MNLRLDFAYDGEPFRGFAKQPEVRTIQGEIDSALSKVFGSEVSSVSAGRTDAGVHAMAQVVGVDGAPDDLDFDKLIATLNGTCGPSIAFHAARAMPDDWHARFSARSRTYLYAIHVGSVPDPFTSRTRLYHREPLDLGAMNEAAGALVGPHDFTSFGRLKDSEASGERILYELRCFPNRDAVVIRARANAFLQQMVRSLAGTLLQVGEHERRPDEMSDIIAAHDRSAAGPVVPPHGLCLVAVEYDEGWSKPSTAAV